MRKIIDNIIVSKLFKKIALNGFLFVVFSPVVLTVSLLDNILNKNEDAKPVVILAYFSSMTHAMLWLLIARMLNLI